MAVPFSNTKLRVPKGFQNILEGLAREVLRSQPENVYEFGASYFESLLKTRSETGHDPAVHGAKHEDRAYNNHSFKKAGLDPSGPQQQDAALKIQTQYRQHAAQQQVEDMKEEEAAVKIQAGFRGYIDRQEVKKRKDGGESPDKAPEPEEEIDIDLTDPEVENAALKIQAQFKGFKARKEIQTKQGKLPPEPETEPEPKKDEDIDIDLNDPDVSKAALKIQSGFRGHMAREEIRQKKKDKDVGGLPQNEFTATPSQPAQSPEAEREQSTEAEEEIDIDLTDPEVEKAAMKIQAGFKGYKTRKSRKDVSDEQEQESASPEKAAAPQPLPAASQYEPKNKRREDTDDTPKEEEEADIDIDLNDPDVEKAATKIQAGFKGFKARKELQMEKERGGKSEGEGEEKVEAKVKVIDYDDPEVQQATLKIQSGFRGYKARRRVKGMREDRKAQGEQTYHVGGGQDEGELEEGLAGEANAEEEAADITEAAEETQAAEEGEKAEGEEEQGGNVEETAEDDVSGGLFD